jgi:hypothetical protein
MNWLDISTYAITACGGAVGLYLALTGRALPKWLRANLPTTASGRRLMGAGSAFFFLAVAILVWGLDKPQRGLSLLAVPLLLLPSVILSLLARAQPKRPQLAGRRISGD